MKYFVQKNVGILLSSILLSLSIVVFFYPATSSVEDIWLDIELETNAYTKAEIFFDTGVGFTPVESYKRTTWQRIPTILSLKLPPKKVRQIRIDFEFPAMAMSLRKLSLFSLNDGGKTKKIDMGNLISTHDIKQVIYQKNGVDVIASGRDPQVVFNIPASYYSPTINYISTTAYAVMLYPAVFILHLLLLFVLRKGRDVIPNRPFLYLHGSLLLLSLILWSGKLFCLHYEKNQTNRMVVQDGKHKKIPYTRSFTRKKVSFPRSDGITIAGYIYTSEQTAENSPVILLLHGNYPAGQLFPLYPVLAAELAKKGFIVMSIDFAGFGISGDPFIHNNPVDLSMRSETIEAINYLYNSEDLQGDIILLGHSMGATPALWVGLADPRVKTIVVIGPPRRVRERFHFDTDINLFWWWTGKIRENQYGISTLPAWYSKNYMVKNILSRDIIYLLPELRRGHKSILFVDGGKETREDKIFLEQYVKSCGHPVSLLRLPKAGHNCNVSFNKTSILYDPETMRQLTTTINKWSKKWVVSQEEETVRSTYQLFRNILQPILNWTL